MTKRIKDEEPCPKCGGLVYRYDDIPEDDQGEYEVIVFECSECDWEQVEAAE